MTYSLRRPFLGVPVVPVLALLLCPAVACSSTDEAAGPAVPTPPAREAALCRALHKELPATVDGRQRRATDPASDFTAAWGDPAISLRCGVPKPGLLRRNPGSDAAEIDGVAWLPERQPDGGIRCTTVQREAWVEVTLPKEVVGDAGDMSALTDLAGAVRRTIPEGIIS
ncbi:DUF3515 domain-containing protein [Streptomyces sp. NPDC049577]|uniref:DUF3515 domain-containing protein n=1 Tax=Streptomyces sp. NPDC049577 TaxID=3155153 RepID=UPI003413BC39